MLNKNPFERNINTFRKPFSSQLTPYNDTDIDVNVSRFCRNYSNGNSLKNGKVIFIGDSGVGKTSLIRRFCKNKFNANNKGTAGVDFEIEAFKILGVPFNLEIWDTAGQERFKWITTSYYRGTNVIVVVFDLSEVNTLYSCGDWLDEVEYQNNHDFVFLVGNKLDTVSEQVNAGMKQIISPLAEEFNAEYWAVSSKTGKNVKHLFWRMALLTFESIVLKEIAAEKYENTDDSCVKINLEMIDEENRPQKNCAC